MKEWSVNQLMWWLHGRTDMLICVTGPTGSGKSTLVGNLGAKYAYKTSFPGRMVRNRPDLLEKVVNSQNPTAAPELETYVRKLVRRKMHTVGRGRSMAIDGMPRTIEQVNFCVDLALDYQKKVIFIYLDVERLERERRLQTRDHIGDKELLIKRLDSDEQVLPSVLSRICQVVHGGKFGYLFMINTGGKNENQEKIRTAEGELDTTFDGGGNVRKAVP